MTNKERSRLISDFRCIRSWVMCNLPIGFDLSAVRTNLMLKVSAGSMQSIVGACDAWIDAHIKLLEGKK